VGVDDRAADELETAFLEILAQRIRLRRGDRHFLRRTELVLNRFAADEAPQVLGKAVVATLEL